MESTDYKHGDEEHILELFQKSFGKPMSAAYWKWRFADNPAGGPMIRLMWDKGVLAGHYAVSPVHLRCDGELILSALSMTTMTHPDYAGKGIFSRLAEELYANQAEQHGLKAVWGYPNNNSHYAFTKNLGWENLEIIPTFFLALGALKETPVTRVEPVSSFTEKHVKAAAEISRKYRVHIDKSLAYLNWRYSDNPLNDYQLFESIDGDESWFAVAKVFPSFDRKDAFEIDLTELAFPADPSLLCELLTAVKQFYAPQAPVKLNLWLPLNDPKHIILEKLGFVNGLPVTYSGIRVLDSRYAALSDNRNWEYAMGYSDVY